MKEGWEVKKLGEVCDLLTDGDWIESKDQSMNGIRLIQTGNIGNGVYKDKSDHAKYISEETFDRLNCTEIFEGDILISRLPDPIGRACILPKMECRMITAVDCSIIRVKEIMLSKFLVYYTLSRPYNKGIEKYVTGAVRKRISRANLSKISVPIPPLPEQSRIVEELDLLSNIIEKKRQQLSELDNLAQSIFYDMFGDPVTNEKGFPLCTVGDIYKFQYGKGNKIPESKGEYLCYGSNGVVGYHTNYNSEDSPIIGHIGAYAGIVNWGKGKHFVTYNGVICKLKDDKFNPIYGYYMLKNQNYMEKVRGGAAQPFVSYDLLESPQAVIPPLDFQQLFAQKIEAIEKQKELIKQSIAETEELFNSKMDYYFN